MPSSRNVAGSELFLQLNGKPVYNQSVTLSVATASSTALDPGQLVLLQSDVACYVTVGAAAVAASSLKLAADEKFYLTLGSGDTVISAIAGGAGTLKIFTMV